MRRIGILAALLAVLAVTLPAGAQARGGSGVLSRDGKVGGVNVQTSTVRDVMRYAGRPTNISRGFGEGNVPHLELRYGCGGGRSSSYVFDRKGRLANFVTTCHRWQTANGTRIGDAQALAEQKEGKQATVAECGDGELIERHGRAVLFVTFFQSGGVVRAFAVAGKNSVLGC